LKCSQRLDRRATKRSSAVHPRRRIGGDTVMRFTALGVTSAAEPPLLESCGRLRFAAPPVLWQPVRLAAHRIPPAAPPSFLEGDLWGDQRRGGPGNRRTASAASKTTHPQPLPVREGALPTPRPPVGGSEESKQKVDQVQARTQGPGGSAFCEAEEPIMAFVRVEQRNAHLAGPVRLDYVTGRDGRVAKAILTAISNTRRSGEGREEEATSIQWTLWGRQAENATEFLDKGSHVNVVGRLKNNHYQNAAGDDVFGFTFTAEEIDYLDSRAKAEARRARLEGDVGGAPVDRAGHSPMRPRAGKTRR